MAIFAVIKQPALEPAALGRAIQAEFPGAHYVLSDAAWLIAAQGTAIDVSAKLGLGRPDSPNTGVVFEVGSYYGRANPAIWTWIKTNWEASGG
jgi:hypothetical protein